MARMAAVSTNTYHGFSLDEALNGIAKAGFRHVELTGVRGWTEHVSADMTDAEIEAVKEKMAKLGLDCIALSGHCNLMDAERLNDFMDNVRLCKKLGGKFIVTSTGEAHFGNNEDSPEELLVGNIKKVMPLVEELDLIMVLEIHGEHGTGTKLLPVVEKVGSPHLAINFDTANVVFYGKTPPEVDLPKCVDKVKYVHLKDKLGAQDEWNFPAIGKGNLKLKETIALLDAANNDSPVSVEVEFTSAGPANVGEVDQALVDSYAFLKSIDCVG